MPSTNNHGETFASIEHFTNSIVDLIKEKTDAVDTVESGEYNRYSGTLTLSKSSGEKIEIGGFGEKTAVFARPEPINRYSTSKVLNYEESGDLKTFRVSTNDEYMTAKNANINFAVVSDKDSPYPIYYWITSDGTGLIYSDADKIYLNEDSNYLFASNAKLTTLDLTGLDTSNVTNMNGMFNGCSSLTTLDLTPLNTSKVTRMSYMFKGCSSLTTLDLEGLDTSKVWDMRGMFTNCSSLITLDLTPLKTSNVTDMSNMFSGCSSLTDLDLMSFNTSNVSGMSSMFYDCSSLTSLDLTPLDTSNVTNMSNMFRSCGALTEIDISSKWSTSKVTSSNNMFSYCNKLPNYDTSKVDVSMAKPTTEGGYLTSNSKEIASGSYSNGILTLLRKDGTTIEIPISN